jgi:hypothetical protein
VTSLSIEGRRIVPPADRPSVNYYGVSPGFFEAMGIRLVAAIGLAAAQALARLAASPLFRVKTIDPVTPSPVFVSLVAAALASLVPAYRAMRTVVLGARRAE